MIGRSSMPLYCSRMLTKLKVRTRLDTETLAHSTLAPSIPIRTPVVSEYSADFNEFMVIYYGDGMAMGYSLKPLFDPFGSIRRKRMLLFQFKRSVYRLLVFHWDDYDILFRCLILFWFPADYLICYNAERFSRLLNVLNYINQLDNIVTADELYFFEYMFSAYTTLYGFLVYLLLKICLTIVLQPENLRLT